jgi:hypothetical protein
MIAWYAYMCWVAFTQDALMGLGWRILLTYYLNPGP